ncbi:lactate utilization protein C [Cupriavidus basilensis]|uniref:Lactate utilization protein C n=1 Tax=Cupriavidus basilensis TaxID=68895 RepID=A0ABT6B4Q9_9BURK|nr:lactate utilization protein C [Cupriavidus basilensis]MDF3838946.1 lactate utilization protein C [Cupriavidus basilensis]
MSELTSRERMLGRLRAAAPAAGADTSQLDARIDAHYQGRRQAASTGPATAAGYAQAMQAALGASHAQAWCASADEWPAQLAARLAAAGATRLLLDPSGPEGAALSAALPATVTALSYDRPIEAWKAELFDTVDAGFTVARSGIAATGTLILAPDAQTPRTVSLVPPLHIALVYADTLHPDLHAAARAERWSAGMPTNLVLVSGPSKTSDIQQTLAYGAHGPRELWVIIVTRGAATGARQ